MRCRVPKGPGRASYGEETEAEHAASWSPVPFTAVSSRVIDRREGGVMRGGDRERGRESEGEPRWEELTGGRTCGRGGEGRVEETEKGAGSYFGTGGREGGRQIS